jgi:hypothetical protein
MGSKFDIENGAGAVDETSQMGSRFDIELALTNRMGSKFDIENRILPCIRYS